MLLENHVCAVIGDAEARKLPIKKLTVREVHIQDTAQLLRQFRGGREARQIRAAALAGTESRRLRLLIRFKKADIPA